MSSCPNQRHVVAKLERVGVHFGDTRAVDGIDLAFRTGEVHALLGENGAGKSTLLKVLAGLLTPQTGCVTMKPGVRIAYVPQELELPWTLTVTDWLFLGQERKTRWRWLDLRSEQILAREWLQRFGLALDPKASLASLSTPQLKWVQIVRAARMEPDLFLLDEPSAPLSQADSEALFRHLRKLRDQGTAIVYVTHRLAEVQALANRVTVLRDGHVVASGTQQSFRAEDLVRLMAGSGAGPPPRQTGAPGDLCLYVDRLGTGIVRDVSLSVCQGEIVGVAGLAGSGRSTLLEALAGIRRFRARQFWRAEPTAFVPEDRFRKGLLYRLSIRDNVFLPAPSFWLQPKWERNELNQWFERLRIRASGVEAPISSLSGGNQQKVLLARTLRRAPRLLLLDEPTAGVDVATKADIYRLFQELAHAGCAVVWASSDAHELLQASHRVIVLRHGRVVADTAAVALNEAQLVALITGADGAVISEQP
ncbi:Ribose import ATP-binding protein RbsA [bacterium HR30]|nr:Ribose import ATP-binding protein RbsA [bacterium HR30]